MKITLLDLADQLRAIGRAVVFYDDHWTGTRAINLRHLGDTEGEIVPNFNESFTHQTFEELTGDAKHESYVAGEDPSVEIPLFVADPALRAILSPTGNASGGYSRRRPTKKRTLVLIPEEMFYSGDTDTYAEIGYTKAGGWTLDDKPLDEVQRELLGQSIWFWRGYFSKPPIPYRHAEGGKAVQSVTFQAMHDKTKPEGNKLYTLGDPTRESVGIELDPTPEEGEGNPE